MDTYSPNIAEVPDDSSEEWRVLSSRVAWIFWLHAYRDQKGGVIDYEDESRAWKEQAEKYRKYTRKALRALKAEGINIVKMD